MSFTARSRTILALILSVITAISAMQAGGVAPSVVSADSTIFIQLLRAPTANESLFANARMQIDLHTGDVQVELHQATANTVYALVFISGSANNSLQIGQLRTNEGGEGQFHAASALGAGTYVGFFELTKAEIVAFASAPTSITIGATASLTASQTTTATQTTTSQTTITSTNQTQTQTTSSTTSANTVEAQINVDPTLATIDAGAFATFNIHVKISGEAGVLLAAKGVPPNSVAIFTEETGVADPDFHSTLTVVTSPTTPPGTYGITLVALINGQEFDTQVVLQVNASSTTTQTMSSSTTSVGNALALTLYTNARQYTTNDTVIVQGRVTDAGGNAVENSVVAVQVDAATGSEVYSQQNLSTDLAGIYQFSFKLPASATAGTYTVFASASKDGYANATTHTTFIVGTSSTPSILIKTVYAGDSSGNPSAVFTAGQTVYIWVTVQNIGATFQGVIWVQVRDPNGVPVSIQIRISQLTTGETITDGFGFTFFGRATVGLYSVNALVSDKLISQGGTFFANTNTEFALTD